MRFPWSTAKRGREISCTACFQQLFQNKNAQAGAEIFQLESKRFSFFILDKAARLYDMQQNSLDGGKRI
jgi:hypothetical protein